ncbi:HPr family phosphocarrier protein [Mahella sp.]|uniref:HPr family phosphocarrier protein n=1 Tax=Mahella sp. TaxID=2798721 RepID=UPI0025B83B76|nr:HPr family phosphocarrier protein [Mahella sp.]MBZ4665318.1 Phosphotransferase system, phosphocarrier protein HPr [Mahella sp.]MDK2903305.1 phosphocarrier protein HPr [Clostridiales bacterium]
MIQEKIKVTNGIGLQSRAAATFVQIANKFRAYVWLEISNKKVDGKSILGLMAMGVYDGSTVELTVSGDDEQEAFKYLADFLCKPFDASAYAKMLEAMPNHNDPEEMKRWREEHPQPHQGQDKHTNEETALGE